MAETDSSIVIGIELDDGTIRKATIQADQLAEKLGGILSNSAGAGIDKSFTGLAVQLRFVADAAQKAFSLISGVIGSAIDEANQADQAINKFNLTLANAGNYTKAASDDFLAFASNLQRIGTVSDDAVVGAADSLVSIGKLSGEALKGATKASVDLSAGLGVDLSSAFDLVAKAAAGNTAALGRYGIKVSEEIPKSERFANVIDQINQKFGGLDVGKANTFGGALTSVRNNFNDVLENIGTMITRSPTVIALIKAIGDAFGLIAEKVGAFGKQGDVFRPIISGGLEFARILTQNVLPVLELLYNFGEFVFKALLTGITTLGAGFSGVTLLIVQGLEAVGIVSADTTAGFAANFESNKTAMQDFALATGESFSQIATDFSITAAVDNFVLDTQRAVDSAISVGPKITNSIAQATEGITNVFALTAKKLADIYNNGIVNLISRGVQTIVTNLAKGKSAFDGLIKVIAGLFGDMLITIGTTVLLSGIGMEAIRASIVGLTGGPAIFAGIALIAAGALLKALSGGGGDSAPTVTQSAGPGSVPGTPDVGAGEAPEQDRNRETKVTINVSGNILDRKETGLELASVLQEYFDTNDGVLAKG